MLNKPRKATLYIALHALLLLFSVATVCSKLASAQPLFSAAFLFFYGMVLILLAVYAICWQQVIKYLPLTAVYANKAITVAWGLLWGVFLFNEQITMQKICGISLIISGILVFSFADRKEAKK